MKIILTHEESEKYFHNALCNGLDYLTSYGIDVDFDDALLERKAIMDHLRKSNPESVYLHSYPAFDNFNEIADERFKNIRAALKGMEDK